MVGPQRIEWRRRAPLSALSNLAWYCVIVVLAVACAWLLFRNEPQQSADGAANPLAALPSALTLLAGLGTVPLAVPVVRRPVVAADHFALLVRPGIFRTFTLPWAGIAEIAVAVVGHDQYLVVKCRPGDRLGGPGPTWVDRFALRRLRGSNATAAARWADYDLAVPMGDFVGGLPARLAALAAFAPDNVGFRGEPDGQSRPGR